MGNWIGGGKDKEKEKDKDKDKDHEEKDKDKDHSKPPDNDHDHSKKPPKIDPAEVSCEKKGEHQMHCTFTLSEKQHESMERAGELEGVGAINLIKVGIIGCTITLVVLIGIFIIIIMRLKRAGGSTKRRNLKTGTGKSLKSKVSGKHSSIGGGGSSKRGKSSRLKSKKSTKSSVKSGKSSKKK